MAEPKAVEEKTNINTPDEVIAALKPFEAKGLKVKFMDDNTSWLLECKGAQDSGHMSIPLHVIKRKAETVAAGARKLIVGTGDMDGVILA